MLLFKSEHIHPILSGEKTQTRRLWPNGRRAVPGAIHQCRTRMLDAGSTFATVKILRVWQERLREIDWRGALAEGYPTRLAYLAAFYRINRRSDRNPTVWVVEFEREG